MKKVFMRIRRLTADTALSGTAFAVVTLLPRLQTPRAAVLPALGGIVSHVGLFMVIACAALYLCRADRTIWRFVSFRDFLSLILASSFTIVVFFIFELLIINPNLSVPGALLVWSFMLIWAAMVGFLATPRIIARAFTEFRLLKRFSVSMPASSIPVILSGDVRRMEAFIRECNQDYASRYEIAGIVIDDRRMHGNFLHGVPVLGSIEELPDIARELNVRGIRPQMLVVAEIDPGQFKRSLECAVQSGLKVGRLPPPGVLRDSQKIRPIEISDLLGRPEIPNDRSAMTSMITGKRVLVTGAGGSIGSELCRQIASLQPAELVTADFGEFNLYTIDRELSDNFPDLSHTTALCDVRDAEMVSFWLEKLRPEVVFHAAALKHVPLIEEHPLEGVKTNVFGTVNVAEACLKHGVEAMITISTDKAVNPCNVMGATKRLAESYCQGLDQLSSNPGGTRFVTVRFGNVLGSAGSVVPLFQRQIEAGGPVTITHPDIKRYFMTIPEAVTLVLEASTLGRKPEHKRGGIYVLDMGQPVKIIDLARHMIQLSGLRPDIDIPIKIIGLRPGEKLYEEVVHNDEALLEAGNRPVMQIVPRSTDLTILRQQIQEFRQACFGKDLDRVLRLLQISVPEYSARSVGSVSRPASAS